MPRGLRSRQADLGSPRHQKTNALKVWQQPGRPRARGKIRVMKSLVPHSLIVLIGVLLFSGDSVCAATAQTSQQRAETATPGKPEKPAVEIRLGYLRAYAPQ